MNSSAELKQRDNQFIHPWDDIVKLGGNQRTLLNKGEGVYVYDSEGNRLLDAPAGMWCVNIGHGREEMAQAVYDQIMALTYVSPWSMTTGPAAQFAAELAEQSPGDLNHVFFTTGGSTAVDSALRFVQFYNNMHGKPAKKHIIAQKRGYLGSTYLCGGVSGKERDKTNMDFEFDMVHHIEAPHPLYKPAGQSDADFLDACVANLENMINEVGPENCALFVAEPILASGGVIVPPEGYNKRTWELCQKYDILYVADEVVTAFGRLGHWFVSKDVFDIQPDIITCAKGLSSGYLPLGATIFSDQIYDVMSNDDERFFAAGQTYAGHPVSCAAALKNIEIMEREKIFENVNTVGPYFEEQLRTLLDLPNVGDVRGKKFMMCVVNVLDKETREFFAEEINISKRISNHCEDLGLIVRPIMDLNVLSPPLTMTRDDVDFVVSTLRKAIELTMADLRREGLLQE